MRTAGQAETEETEQNKNNIIIGWSKLNVLGLFFLYFFCLFVPFG